MLSELDLAHRLRQERGDVLRWSTTARQWQVKQAGQWITDHDLEAQRLVHGIVARAALDEGRPDLASWATINAVLHIARATLAERTTPTGGTTP